MSHARTASVRAPLWPCLPLVFALGCGASADGLGQHSQAIVNGTDDNSDPAVVMLLSQESGSTVAHLCTAEVISPTVLLTAAHCVDAAGDTLFYVFKGPDLDRPTSADWLGVQSVHANGDFNINKLYNGHDIGVVVLSQPTSIVPLRFNRSVLNSSWMGTAVRLVGYGTSDAAGAKGAGRKRAAHTTLGRVTSYLFNVGDANGQNCHGDSGGPALVNIDGVETIVGVTSFGTDPCDEGGYDTRVDLYASWIDHYLHPDAECTPDCKAGSCDDGCGGSCGCKNDSQGGLSGEPSQTQAPGGTSGSSDVGPEIRGGCSIAAHTPESTLPTLLCVVLGLWIVRRRPVPVGARVRSRRRR